MIYFTVFLGRAFSKPDDQRNWPGEKTFTVEFRDVVYVEFISSDVMMCVDRAISLSAIKTSTYSDYLCSTIL